jgi:histone H3/H4
MVRALVRQDRGIDYHLSSRLVRSPFRRICRKHASKHGRRALLDQQTHKLNG